MKPILAWIALSASSVKDIVGQCAPVAGLLRRRNCTSRRIARRVAQRQRIACVIHQGLQYLHFRWFPVQLATVCLRPSLLSVHPRTFDTTVPLAACRAAGTGIGRWKLGSATTITSHDMLESRLPLVSVYLAFHCARQCTTPIKKPKDLYMCEIYNKRSDGI